eukprot:Blabericola_migrator_1__7007@NODE_3550_length_1686_cov_9_324892_g2203_i0_p2_GENE_NODE_3550_length_1686_cov_9_324892_g2203_i0NODE_3550_length_1686_cov_9_324892_g2203_i0_p2_ORF_typecomplete_len132_score13_44TMEM192/PF14802_6/0_026_NODE_3550_length_1686_cov_9_324892_g2203_i0185580
MRSLVHFDKAHDSQRSVLKTSQSVLIFSISSACLCQVAVLRDANQAYIGTYNHCQRLDIVWLSSFGPITCQIELLICLPLFIMITVNYSHYTSPRHPPKHHRQTRPNDFVPANTQHTLKTPLLLVPKIDRC